MHQEKSAYQKVQKNRYFRAEHSSKNWSKKKDKEIFGKEKTSINNKKKTALFVLAVVAVSCVLLLLFYRPWETELTIAEKDYQDTSLNSLIESTENVDKAACYRKGESLLEQNEYLSAAIEFGKADGFEDARERSLELWQRYGNNSTLVADSFWIIGIEDDGNIALTSSSGENEDDDSYDGSIAKLNEEQDAISLGLYGGTGYASDFVKLKMDGTLLYSPFLDGTIDNTDLSAFKDIIQIACVGVQLIGLNSSGNIIIYDRSENETFNIDDKEWHDITYISSVTSHSFLKLLLLKI